MSDDSAENASIFRFKPHVLHVDTPEEIVLLDYQAGKYFGLKGSVRHAFQRLREGAPLDEMVVELARCCDVSEAEVKQDLTSILTELQKAGLVSRDHR